MVMNTLDQMGDVIKSVPPTEDLEQEKFEHSFDVVVVTDAEAKAIEDAQHYHECHCSHGNSNHRDNRYHVDSIRTLLRKEIASGNI